MTLKVKILENVFRNSSTGHRTTFRDQIWWKSAVAKFSKGRVVFQTKKTRAPRDSSQSPFWPKWADRAPNSLNVVTSWPLHVYRIWSGSAAFLPDLFRIDWFFSRKSQYNIGFQPAIIMILSTKITVLQSSVNPGRFIDHFHKRIKFILIMRYWPTLVHRRLTYALCGWSSWAIDRWLTR